MSKYTNIYCLGNLLTIHYNIKQLLLIVTGLSLLLFIGLSFFNPDFIQQRVDSFVNRWNQSPPQDFIIGQIQFVLRNQEGFLGNGLGKGTSSARVFGPITFLETFHSKLIFELGMPGFFIYMTFLTSLLIFSLSFLFISATARILSFI